MENKKTNVLLIMSDDHGYWAMGCSGNKEIITPHLDRLAKNGIRFENFFCTSPVCSPARASLFTGQIPSQHGVHDWIHKGHMSECEIEEKLKAKLYEENNGWEYDWPKKQIKQDIGVQYLKGHKLFTEILNEQGYECGLAGKWHLGDSGNPQGGFSYWRTMAMGGDNYYYPVVLEDGKFVMKKETYITDYITEEANKFLTSERDKEKPFYLSVHYTAPHAPWNKEQHPEEVYKLYEECPFESVPYEELHPWGDVKGKTDEEHRKIHKVYLQGYYTAVTAMDRSIGSLLDTLEQEGVLENTLIIFTGDNGMSMGHHGIYGKGNGTFPMNMYDTAVKVPMIMSLPGKVPNQKVAMQLLSHYDFAPTLLDYLNIEECLGDNLPGSSFADILRGEESEGREDVVIMDEYGPVRMIRTKEWKYIHRYPYGPHELYHLLQDPDEKMNLIGEANCKEILVELRGKLTNWFNQYVDPAVDGKCEAVTGKGQIGFVGVKSEGKQAFRNLQL